MHFCTPCFGQFLVGIVFEYMFRAIFGPGFSLFLVILGIFGRPSGLLHIGSGQLKLSPRQGAQCEISDPARLNSNSI